jgi:putative transposase
MGFHGHAYTLDPLRLETLTHGTATRAYLIRLSTFQQQPLLGSYDQGTLCLNDCGLIVADEWVRAAKHRPGIDVDALAITPTRLSSILLLKLTTVLDSSPSGYLEQPKPWLLSSFIASFKAAAAKRINLRRSRLGQAVWQSSYDEMLITDGDRLAHIREQMQGAADLA